MLAHLPDLLLDQAGRHRPGPRRGQADGGGLWRTDHVRFASWARHDLSPFPSDGPAAFYAESFGLLLQSKLGGWCKGRMTCRTPGNGKSCWWTMIAWAGRRWPTGYAAKALT